MRSGRLNERLTVYALTNTIDSYGAAVSALSLIGSYWCRVESNRHDRSENDIDRVVYNPTIRFELRSSVPIVNGYIIEHDGLRYVIDAIEKNRNLDRQTLYCTRYEQ